MPKKCCIPNCKIQQDDPEGLELSFYKIPADENIKKKWLEQLNLLNVEIKKYSYVCSRHFEENCFDATTSAGKNGRLKKGSCPTIFLDFRNLKLQNIDQIEVIDSDITSTNFLYNDTDLINNSTEDVEMSSMQDINSEMPNDVLSDKTINLIPCQESHVESYSNDNYKKESEDNSANEIRSSKCSNIFRRSLSNIDLSTIEFNAENLPTLKQLLLNGQKEIVALRRKLKSRKMKVYRYKKRVTDVKSFVSHMKQNKYITSKVSDLLEVSMSSDIHQ